MAQPLQSGPLGAGQTHLVESGGAEDLALSRSVAGYVAQVRAGEALEACGEARFPHSSACARESAGCSLQEAGAMMPKERHLAAWAYGPWPTTTEVEEIGCQSATVKQSGSIE